MMSRFRWRFGVHESIRRLATTTLVGFFLVSVGLVYWQVIRGPELVARADNPALLEEELRTRRGTILARHGEVLATSEAGPDGRMRRVYPYPALATTVGLFSPRFGVTGLEGSFNQYLSCQRGTDLGSILDDKLFHRPKKGMEVHTTIDLRLQKTLDKAMGEAKGAAVALDPRTGAVLALVSHPFFDPNRLVAFDDPTAGTYWEVLKRDVDAPLVNRATQGLYAPGSTFKTVTLAAALETGVVTPNIQFSHTLNVPNSQHPVPWHANQYVSCQNHLQEQFDLAHAYAYSCNVTFSELGLKIGAEAYTRFARDFGLESKPPLDIEAEASQLFHTKNYFGGDERFYALASTAMGQGELAVTPLQMALVAATIANDGVVPSPYLVAEVRDLNGAVVWQRKPQGWRQAVSAATARLVAEAMVVGVEDGWAAPAKVAGVKVAGKTGSAQVGPSGKPHSWFIGFAPADNPQVAVAVIKEFGGPGSLEAAPVARALFEAVLRDR